TIIIPMSVKTDSIIIRNFEPKDNDAVYALILSILETEYSDLSAEAYLDDIGNITANYQNDGDHFFVCEDNNRIIGTVAVKQEDKKTALLRRLFLNPNYRGKGIGKQLIQTAIDFAKSKKFKMIYFDGNNHMLHIKSILEKVGFKLKEDINLPGVEIFKLYYPLV
ncbi:MAG TPA: GNAT family N-acetyltransferase, partial [Spirochaetota bacterium]|nr:GNAT family N-acetyltransferase [Spirochaetota bacterium]